MNFFAKKNRLLRGAFIRAVMLVIGLVCSLDGLVTKAAMRLPEELLAVEPWSMPGPSIPEVETSITIGWPGEQNKPGREPAIQQTAPSRPLLPESSRVTLDRARRANPGQKNKRALAELLGLVAAPGEEQIGLLRFEGFRKCREFVAINC
jgi:hypothetical protein